MSEQVASVKHQGIRSRINSMANHARRPAAVVMASLALGGAVEASADTPVAEAHGPAPHLVKPGHVQEYAQVVASDPSGEQLRNFPAGTFAFRETCQLNGQKVSRDVIANKPIQPLGKCYLGKPVAINEKPSLYGSWIQRSKAKQKVAKATPKNNHFTFIEQQTGVIGGPPVPNYPAKTAPTATPTQPEQPTPDPEPGVDPFASGNIGVDISWAQCGTANEHPNGFDFGIVDVSGGLGYSANPCLASEAANFPDDQLNLYVNTGWNSASVHIDPNSPRVCESADQECLAYNYGYNAGLYAVNAAIQAGVPVTVRWWEDVESDATWSEDTNQNRQSLLGEHDALMDSGAKSVGIYSTTVQWQDLAGGWQNGWESWGATSWTTAEDAQTYCENHEFTGGPSAMMQYLPTTELDYNVSC